MAILGAILAIIGWLTGIQILLIIGVVLFIVGIILLAAFASGHAVGGHRWY